MRVVQFIDTSVLLEVLDVPGHNSRHSEIFEELDKRIGEGVTFVLPVTTLIETGNHIAQCGGDRRSAAQRFVSALELARSSTPPWIVRDVAWNSKFLESFVGGDSSGADLLTHLTNATLGAGDVAILVEREQFHLGVSAAVQIWSLDTQLEAHS